MLAKRRGAAEMVLLTIITGAVVLAAGVVLYGSSLFQVSAQQETVSVTGIELWVHGNDPNGLAWGAFTIRNNGDKITSIDKIVVRGTEVPFKQWYADTSITSRMIQQPMNFTGWSDTNGLMNNNTNVNCNPSSTMELVLEQNTNPASDGWFCGRTTSGPIVLEQNQATIIYFRLNNGTISGLDGGNTANVSVFAGNTLVKQNTNIASKT